MLGFFDLFVRAWRKHMEMRDRNRGALFDPERGLHPFCYNLCAWACSADLQMTFLGKIDGAFGLEDSALETNRCVLSFLDRFQHSHPVASLLNNVGAAADLALACEKLNGGLHIECTAKLRRVRRVK